MYRGYVSTLLREVFAFGAQFYCYEMTKRLLLRIENKEKNSQFDSLLAGGIGGIGCWLFSYP